MVICRPLRDDEVLPVQTHRVVPVLTKEEEEEKSKEVRAWVERGREGRKGRGRALQEYGLRASKLTFRHFGGVLRERSPFQGLHCIVTTLPRVWTHNIHGLIPCT